MKTYLIQVRNKRSGDSSRRCYRQIIKLYSIEQLYSYLEECFSQDEVDILLVEEL